MTKEFYSNGKLLLTGEYAVLDGATCLAIPTTYGQSMTVTKTTDTNITWRSYDELNNIWFEGTFNSLQITNTKNKSENWLQTAKTLQSILKEAQSLNPSFLNNEHGFLIKTKLTFPRDWGLGSSSTLINNIAQWAKVNAFTLLENTMGGSGYDIACAQNSTAILYQKNTPNPIIEKVDYNPLFAENIYFIHLNKKQNSREAIHQYRNCSFNKQKLVADVTAITQRITQCTNLPNFESLITKHEAILSNILQIQTVKQCLFSDYKGAIKSLGGWGGDFILATGDSDTPTYFKNKGYATVIKYADMVLEK